MRYLAFRCNIMPNYEIAWDGTTNSGKLVPGLGGYRHIYRYDAYRMPRDAKWKESGQAILYQEG